MTVAEDILNEILSAGVVQSIVDGHHGAELFKLLRDHGGKQAAMLSTCNVASSEWRLRMPNGVEVEVVESNLFGPFTEVTVL